MAPKSPTPMDVARDATRVRAAHAASLADRLRAIRPATDLESIRVVHAPGRVNLIGEHTDYNDGYVLPIAIDRGITIALVPTDDRRVEVTLAESGERAGFDLDDIGPRTDGWIDYVAGTAWSMADHGLELHGARCVLGSDLPQGSGLSSSAALELAAAFALSGGEAPAVDRMTLARLCQRAENVHVGVNCGLMDQFASAHGVPDAAMLLDCRSLEYRTVPIAPDEVALVVCDSGSQRRLGESGYNERRAQCDAAVAAIAAAGFAVSSLRDVTPAMLEALDGTLDALLVARARHVVDENARVLEAVAALETGDTPRLGRLVSESQASLRDLYEVSSPELDALVEIAESVPGVLGTRLTGAGFGGSTITLVRRDAVRSLIEAVEERYQARTGLTPFAFEVRPSGGAGLVDGWR